jgi:predicted metal-binding membrane protein
VTKPQTLEALLRREHLIAGGALAVLAALAWTYLILLSYVISPAMPGMAMTEVFRPWTLTQFAFAFAMWSAMMIGMMTPSIAPAILAYARLSEHPVARNNPLAPIGWFVAGYLFAWLGYAFIATVMQAGFLRSGLITPSLHSASGFFGGIVFILAGAYQLTRLKHACLAYCRSPLTFIHDQGGFRPSTGSALALGLKHGLYCVLCCWALMAILFVVGVMDLLWIAVISIWVLVEKIFARGILTHLLGVVLIALGIVFLVQALT